MSKTKKNTQSMLIRWLLYIGGLVILALGISLNTRTCLGVSPKISVAYSVADIFSLNFGNVTFALYVDGDKYKEVLETIEFPIYGQITSFSFLWQ